LIYQTMWGAIPLGGRSDGSYELCYDHSQWQEADAVVFHLPQLRQSGFPPRKLPGQRWVAWSMESEVSYPMLARRTELSAVFDLWMTYQRDSDVWCPYFGPDMIAGFRAPASPKTATSPVAAFVSNPFDASGRKALLAGLMQCMPVDSFGKLFRNRSMQDTPDRSAKQGVIARYKFTLAFESSICRDYVTEKFFDALLAGSVPVYLSAPNIAKLAPADDCYVDASRFESPRTLAAHLMALAHDEDAYAALLRWRDRPLRTEFVEMAEGVRRHCFQRLADRLHAMRGP
jgi:alpha-1,3-fucosyltransferase 10